MHFIFYQFQQQQQHVSYLQHHCNVLHLYLTTNPLLLAKPTWECQHLYFLHAV